MAYFNKTDILLPKNIKDNWAVIACDQFTSDLSYWDRVASAVGGDKSTYNLILPEIFLEDNSEKRIEKINKNMKDYLDSGVFETYENSMIFVSRKQSDGLVMDGIIGAINLDDYDYKKGAKSLVRASEQTVIERIPPRVRIRKDAPLEFPHILLLIDDPSLSVIEPIADKKDDFKKLYDLKLMENGGEVEGYLLSDEAIEKIGEALEKLIENSDDKLLFAVGDGNHSLATAKTCAETAESSKAKTAMVEIVNIHSPAINFEPIYRVLFDCDANEVINDFINDNGGEYEGADAHVFTVVTADGERKIGIKPTAKLPVGTLQTYLDEYLKAHSEIKIDYIHGIEATKQLCKAENTVGFIFEGMKKDELFEAIKADGSLPRKTFSMGHAEDKRYYIEGRKIK